MPERPGAPRIARRVSGEALAWTVAAAVFLAAYVGWLGAPVSAIAPHLGIVALAAFGLACGRLLLAAIVPVRIAAYLSSSLLVAALATLASLYAAMLVG